MAYWYPDAVLVVFCKAPIPGQVKTRLIPALSAIEACEIHKELSLRILTLAAAAHLCPIQLWCSPSTDHDFFKDAKAEFGVGLYTQQGEDLGARMDYAFHHALKSYRQAILIGCDSPSLTATDLEQAIILQEATDVVLAPAEDGGYVLIALKTSCPELFKDMPWGSNQVFNQTVRRLNDLQLNYHLINRHWDIDTIADLNRYRELKRRT